jgi:hypothetical protein
LEADRPDQTESPAIVPAKHFQIETGFVRERTDPSTKTYVNPSVLWKYGVNNVFELRLITEMNTIKQSGSSISGLVPVALGFKVKISEEKGILPRTSLIAHLNMRSWASKEFMAEKYAPDFRFTMQHTLSEKFSLGYNLGMEWDGEESVPEYIYTLTTGFQATEKLGMYVELYGFAAERHTADHRFDAGITFLAAPWLLLDVSGGVGISKIAPQNFFGAGFTVRFHQ